MRRLKPYSKINTYYTMRFFFSLLFALMLFTANSQNDWKPAGNKISTNWSAKVDPAKPLNEYPRPQLTRKNWMNLNGLWQYALLPVANASAIPATTDGKILVPFAIESALSGVGKTVGKDSVLWYKNTFQVPSAMRKGKIVLHFGAVDWATEVYINKIKVGEHKGGYDPFSFNITSALQKGTAQEIAVRVWDPSNDGPQPRGKQVKKPEGIWYTPVTGIWQTVWIENVPETYISSIDKVPDIDNGIIAVTVSANNLQPGDEISIKALDGSQLIASQTISNNEPAKLSIPSPKLWSPSNPFLYDLQVSITRKGKMIDEAGSYFAMRKISMKADAQGIQRMLLNNQFLFQYGPLDQGWWPDGLYTAPTDEALLFDIAETKNMGFNMIRKHVKVEPARWYYYADKLGMLVWQDMPSGDLGGNSWDSRPGQITGRKMEKDRTAESEAIYKTEWNAIIKALHPFPCIVVWVPFNEAWGQFKTKEITEWTKKLDPSRLVNAASGGNFLENVGDILDLHNYPDPQMPTPYLFGKKQVVVLGEFGGLGLPLEEHTWQDKNNWGYQTFKNQQELETRYARLMNDLSALIPLGLSAAVYTQTTDVEIETNGLMTYDRKVFKIDPKRLKELHQKLYQQRN